MRQIENAVEYKTLLPHSNLCIRLIANGLYCIVFTFSSLLSWWPVLYPYSSFDTIAPIAINCVNGSHWIFIWSHMQCQILTRKSLHDSKSKYTYTSENSSRVHWGVKTSRRPIIWRKCKWKEETFYQFFLKLTFSWFMCFNILSSL